MIDYKEGELSSQQSYNDTGTESRHSMSYTVKTGLSVCYTNLLVYWNSSRVMTYSVMQLDAASILPHLFGLFLKVSVVQ